MPYLRIISSLFWFSSGAFCRLNFVNPPPFGDVSDFSGNPTYAEGSIVNVIWTEGEVGKGASLVLYQLNDTNGDWFGDMEYLTQGAVGVTRYSWLVGTRKNLSASKMFYLSLFQEGNSRSDSNSHYFYIQPKNARASPRGSSTASLSTTSAVTSSIAGPSASGQSSALPSSSIPTSATSSAPTSDNQSNPSLQRSSSIAAGAKIGLGVGVSAALLLGLLTGYLLLRRRNERDKLDTSESHQPQDGSKYHGNAYDKGGYYGPNPNEAAPRSPIELGRHASPFSPSYDKQASLDGNRPLQQYHNGLSELP